MWRPLRSYRALLRHTFPAFPALCAVLLVLSACASAAEAPSGSPDTSAAPPQPLAFVGTWSGVVMVNTETAYDVAVRGSRSTKESTLARRFLVLTFEKEGEGLAGSLMEVPDRMSLRENHWRSTPLAQVGTEGPRIQFDWLPESQACGLEIELSDDRSLLKGSYRCRVKDVHHTMISQTHRSHFELRRGT